MRAWRVVGVLAALGCGGRDGGDDDDDLYDGCAVAEDCDVPAGAADGVEPACLDKAGEGFCTTDCALDADCGDPDLVCASFEDEAATYCFPACEGDEDGCPPGFGCRSTGGGADNRKVCFPE